MDVKTSLSYLTIGAKTSRTPLNAHTESIPTIQLFKDLSLAHLAQRFADLQTKFRIPNCRISCRDSELPFSAIGFVDGLEAVMI